MVQAARSDQIRPPNRTLLLINIKVVSRAVC